MTHVLDTTPLMSAPTHCYWVYTKKGSDLLNVPSGAVVSGDPYRAPKYWVIENLVRSEELE